MRVFPGMIIMWTGTGTDLPDGWEFCDGIDTRPNLFNKFILSYGSTYNTLRAVGGEETHTLTSSEIPAHTHTVTLGTGGTLHNHGVTGNKDGSDEPLGDYPEGCSASDIEDVTFTSETANHTHGLTVSNNAGGGAHENMPPYYVLAYIIKV